MAFEHYHYGYPSTNDLHQDDVQRDIQRIPDWAVGFDAWQTFVLNPNAAVPLGAFLPPLPSVRAAAGSPRVFVSHASADLLFAERIARLVHDSHRLFWLDASDPTLASITKTHAAYPKAVALLIEIALLNCDYLIAAYTDTADRKSRWVPYEYGRAVAPRLFAAAAGGPDRVCSWVPQLPPCAPAAALPEFLLLHPRHRTEPDVDSWVLSLPPPTYPLPVWPVPTATARLSPEAT